MRTAMIAGLVIWALIFVVLALSAGIQGSIMGVIAFLIIAALPVMWSKEILSKVG